jgi:hypothetical protein
LNQLKKKKPEVGGSPGAVQALKMENDAHAVGPDVPIANTRMLNRDLRVPICRMSDRRFYIRATDTFAP